MSAELYIEQEKRKLEYFRPPCFFCNNIVEINENLGGIKIVIGEIQKYVYGHSAHIDEYKQRLHEYGGK